MRISYLPDRQVYSARVKREEKPALLKQKWRWNRPASRAETDVIERVEPFKEFCDEDARKHLDSQLAERDAIIDQSRALDTDFVGEVAEGLALFGFQNAGVEYALERSDTLIGDDPGLGKSPQFCSVANELFNRGQLRDVLIICEASQKAHWPRMWEQWTTTDLTIGIVERKIRQRKGVKQTITIIPDTDVVVVNYDILEHIHEWAREQEWSLIGVDECQALRNEDSGRTREVLGGENVLVERRSKGRTKRVRLAAQSPIPATRRVFLTGTFLENRPIDLWPICKAFDPEGLGADKEAFARRYCSGYYDDYGLNARGASNLWELQKRLRSTFMIRRTTEQALPDMPPKHRRPIFLPADKFKSVLQREDDVLAKGLAALEDHLELTAGGDMSERAFSVWDTLQERYGDDIFSMSYESILDEVPEEAAIAIEEIANMRSALALAKVPYVIDYIRDLNEAGEKVVCFFYHRAVGEALKAAWSNSCAYIDGSVPSMKRQPEVDRFMEDAGCMNLFGQITAAGKGFTMTAARHVVFAELDWRRGAMTQAENRIWRIPQNAVCWIHHIIVEGSIEVRQSHSLIEKQSVSDAAMDLTPEEMQQLMENRNAAA